MTKERGVVQLTADDLLLRAPNVNPRAVATWDFDAAGVPRGAPDRPDRLDDRCQWCAGPLPPRRSTYCCNPCGRRYALAFLAIPLFKRLVLYRDRYTCQACGVSPTFFADNGGSSTRQLPAIGELHLDHIVPVSKGGLMTWANTRILCARCNLSRGNREEWQPALTHGRDVK